MLSYCFEVTADNAEQVLPPKEDNSALASLRNRIEAFRLDENGLEKDYFIFLEQYHGNHLTLGAALTEHLGREPQDFLQSLGLTGVRLEKAEEITGSRLRGMLEKAEDQKLVADWRSWPDQFACLHFYRRGGHHFEPDSRILRDKLLARKRPWAELARRTEELMYSGTLLPELERIRRPAAAPFSGGYPVHYLVQAEHFPDQQEIVGLLLQALYQAGRLESRRYCICDLDDIKGFMDVTEICGNAAYGALVVMAGEVERGGAFAKSDLNSIKLLADCFDLFGDSLQMVVCLATGAAEAREALLEQLEGTVLVELREEPATPEQARAYLRKRAKKDGVPGDRTLYRGLDDGPSLRRTELDERHRRWHDCLLRSRVYPQYAHMTPARDLAAARKPKGDAYQRLQELVGLERVKAVTDQILDYAKAQRLFAAQGMVSAMPALHMVFTGSPGSAKTTVARLLAEILEENRVLPYGRLYEVGRADLVGKYVGWTAKLVHEAFQNA